MKRRRFLQSGGAALGGWGLLGAGLGAGLLGGAGCVGPGKESAPSLKAAAAPGWPGASLTELQQALASGRVTSVALVEACLERIRILDRVEAGGAGSSAEWRLNSIIEQNPEGRALAVQRDAERRSGRSAGPLHGIPVLLKDNIDTGDRMMTTAGSLAMDGARAARDSTVAARLRAAGAILLAKTNLSEWANFRGQRSVSGWSGRGGQTRNPHCLACNPSGSSSGSAAAVAASLAPVAVGTETNGSIVSPASYCGVVGLKPTVGLISRAGIIPISASQDTAGPMTRTVADAALLLGVLAGEDERDAATRPEAAVGPRAGRRVERDYTRFLDPGALRGARLGVARSLFRLHRRVDGVFAAALSALQEAGAVLVDVKLPSRQELDGADFQVMLYEFKDGLNAYLRAAGPRSPMGSLADVIAFNEREAARELALFGQEILIEAQAKGPLTDPAYLEAKARCVKWSESLAAMFKADGVEAVVAPSAGPAHVLDPFHGDRGLGGSSTYAAVSGFPNITVPCGGVLGLPVGLSFFGPAWSEPRLLGLAHAFESATRARLAPTFRATAPAWA